MVRRVLFIVVALALVLSVVSPVLADDGKPKVVGNPKGLVGKALQGTIKSISEDKKTWTIDAPRYDEDIEVDVSDPNLKVHWPGNKDAKVTDFKVGARVAIKLASKQKDQKDQNGAYKARAVHFIPGKVIGHFTGVITEVTITDGKVTGVKVKKNNGEPNAFTVTDNTKVAEGRETKPLSYLAKDQRVTVVAWTLEDPDVALAIVIRK